MNKLLVAIFGTGVYFYAGPILFQYGHTSYFGIPTNLIEPSIRDNIVFFFDLTRIMGMVAGHLSFWVWVILVIFTLVIWSLLAFQVVHRTLLSVILVALTVSSLFGFYSFGNKIAGLRTDFKVLPEGCLSAEKGITHIIPAFYQTTALIVAIHSDTKKLTGSFLPKESSELGCDIQKKTIGPILQ